MKSHLETRLEALRDGLTDAADGYERAITRVDDALLRTAFETALADKRRSIAEVEACLPTRAAEDAGTLIGAVTKAVVTLRVAVTGDSSLLPGTIDGETRITERCHEALAAARDHPRMHEALTRITERQSRTISMLRALELARS